MKLGVVGTGMIVNEFMPVLTAMKDLKITALCSTKRSMEKCETLCHQYKILGQYTDFDTMLEEADIDAIYIAVPNKLHYEMARKGLEKGKHVIIEKPFTVNYEDSKKLVAIAKEKKLFLYEAITTIFQDNYQKAKEYLPKIGEVRIVNCNFSQYSSRYDNFKKGIVAPVFDKEQAGGALLDLNLYNVHLVQGLFGKPKSFTYAPNMEKGVDVSGILLLNYPDFKAVCTAAKDSDGLSSCVIQGTDGFIVISRTANACAHLEIHLRKEDQVLVFDDNKNSRAVNEFECFVKEIETNDLDTCYKRLEHTLCVNETLTEAYDKYVK